MQDFIFQLQTQFISQSNTQIYVCILHVYFTNKTVQMNSSMTIINVQEMVSDCRGHVINRLLTIKLCLTSDMQCSATCNPGVSQFSLTCGTKSLCKSTAVITESLHSGHRTRIKLIFHISKIQPRNGSLEPGRSLETGRIRSAVY